MTEKINQASGRSIPVESQVIWVKNGQRSEDLIHFLAPGVQSLPLIRNSQAPNTPSSQKNGPTTSGFTTSERIEGPRRHRSERSKKNLRNSLVASAIISSLAAGYYYNAFNIQPIAHDAIASLGLGNTDTMPDNGITMLPPLTHNPESLSADQCTLPGAVYAVATISGNLPIVGRLTDKEHPVLYNASPYMVAGKEKTMIKSDADRFHKFVTKSGYPEVTLNNMPLGLTICDLGGGIAKVGNTFIINRSKLQIMFTDPTSKSMLSSPINAQPQLTSNTVASLDPNKGEWVTYPVNGLFLYDGKDKSTSEVNDPVLNTAVSSLVKTMQDPQVLRTLIAIMEQQAVKEFSSSVTNKDAVTYRDSKTKSLQPAIDTMLLDRLGADPKTTTFNDADYSVKMDVPIDHATTKTIIEKNAITNIDLAQTFRLTSANVVFGFPEVTKIATMPTTTQSPKPSQTKTTTP